MKRILCVLLCFVLLFSMASCKPAGGNEPLESESQTEQTTNAETPPATEPATEPEPVPTAVIREKVIYLFVDDFHTLDYTVSETNGIPDGSAEEIVWTSSNERCVGVKNGRIFARREGSAIVSGGGESVCSVRVVSRIMPTVSVNTRGEHILSTTTYTPCYISVESRNSDYSFDDAKAGIRLRGNSTYNLPKKPYRIKFISAQNLLGMNEGAACKSWVLLADRYDNSMIRNSTCLSLASVIVKEYTSDWRYVKLEINGEFQGVYLLAEQPQIHAERVNIEEAGEETEALRSGYLAELNAQSPRPAFKIDISELDFTTFRGKKSPSRDLIYDLKNNSVSTEQKKFVGKFFQNVFTVVYEATYNDTYYELDENHDLVLSASLTSAEEAISAVIDVDSFVRMYLLTELICNHDAFQKSMYQHVDFTENGTGLLTYSCPWDFDFTMYRFEDLKYYDPEEYLASERVTWFVMMMNHEWFRELVRDYWNQITEETDHFSAVIEMMLAISEEYSDEFIEDGALWGREEPQAECAATVHEWLKTRIAWLDEQFGEGVFDGVSSIE